MTNRRSLCLCSAALVTLASVLVGCTGSINGATNSGDTKYLIVADDGGNRTLIYGAPFSTDQSASAVVGQPNFTTNTPDATASTMYYPTGIAVDAAGNIYVTDYTNCRVLRFAPPFSNGMNANLVLGEPNFTDSCDMAIPTPSASNLAPSNGLCFDGSGDLWVVDTNHHRVVEFVPPFSNTMAASLVIGQPDFTHDLGYQGAPGPSASSLYYPESCVFDSSGDVWVSDSYRVLEFKPPFSSGMSASLVLGQVNFTALSEDMIAANTFMPLEAVFDASGNLWVADNIFNRVLKFTPPFETNMNASLVLGQVDFLHGQANQGINQGETPSAATLFSPWGVAFDGGGNLFVSDTENNRILIFTPPFTNGMNASHVIGQASFSTTTSATTAEGLMFPEGLATTAH